MARVKLAHYRCLACGYEWQGLPGPYRTLTEPKLPTECLACGHLYVEWLNFSEWQR